MAVTRVSRVESKARTRDDLIVAARGVFLERGFHPATLEEISEAAGYTKGAVYSNFSGKDDLFLAVLERHYAERAAMYEAVLFGESEFEDTFRASARLMLDAFAREPAWWPLLSEFVRHAARRRRAERPAPGSPRPVHRCRCRHDRASCRTATGVTFAIPAKEIARGSQRPLARHRTRPPARPGHRVGTACSRRCTSATRSASPASRTAP